MVRSHFSSLLLVMLVACLACASTARRESEAQDVSRNEARQKGAALIEAGAYADAATELEALTRAMPKDDQAFVMLGDAYRGTGDFARSVAAYEQAIRLDYGDYLAHRKLGVVLMENGKTGRALTEFEVALRFGKDDALSHYNYGLALHELGRPAEALTQWKLARELEPENAEFAEAMGIGLAGVDDAASLEAFRDAERLGAKDAAFSNNYGLALERMHKDADAEQWFRAAIDDTDDRRENEYRRNLALNFLRRNLNADAAREFEQLATRDGGVWSTAVYLARARVAIEEWDKAIAGLEAFALDVETGKVERTSPRIDRMPPTLSEALDVLGMAYRGRKERKRAVEYLQRAVALEPDDPARLNNYGVVLAENGSLAEARSQWLRVLELDPENATAKANLAAFGR